MATRNQTPEESFQYRQVPASVSGPKARAHTSLGQRPRLLVQEMQRAEGPIHSGRIRTHGPGLQPSSARPMLTWAVGPGWYDSHLWCCRNEPRNLWVIKREDWRTPGPGGYRCAPGIGIAPPGSPALAGQPLNWASLTVSTPEAGGPMTRSREGKAFRGGQDQRPLAETQFHLGRGGREFLDDLVEVLLASADGAVETDLGGIARRDGHRHTFLVDVQADAVNDLAHGCLVSLPVCCCGREIGFDQAGGQARGASAPQATHVTTGSKHSFAFIAEP